MSFSLVPLLLHDDDVPETVRAALRDANHATAGARQAHLETAARALHRDAHLECDEARELVGLR